MFLLYLAALFIIAIVGLVVYLPDEKDTEADKKQNESDRFYFKVCLVIVVIYLFIKLLGALL